MSCRSFECWRPDRWISNEDAGRNSIRSLPTRIQRLPAPSEGGRSGLCGWQASARRAATQLHRRADRAGSKLRLLLDGFRPSIWIGGYNQYTQEILDQGSPLHEFRPDLVVMMIRLEEVMPDFLDEFGSRPSSHWAERVAQKVAGDRRPRRADRGSVSRPSDRAGHDAFPWGLFRDQRCSAP